MASGGGWPFLEETLGAAQAIKLADASEAVQRSFQTLNEARGTAVIRDQTFGNALDVFNFSAINLGIGVMPVVAAQAMRQGTFTVGDFALFVSYFGSITGFPRWVGRAFARYRQAEVWSSGCRRFLEGAPPDTLVDRRWGKAVGGCRRPGRPTNQLPGPGKGELE